MNLFRGSKIILNTKPRPVGGRSFCSPSSLHVQANLLKQSPIGYKISLLVRSQKLTEAKALFQSSPEPVGAGWLLSAEKDLTNAWDIYSTLLTQSKPNDTVLFFLGQLCRSSGSPERAVALWAEVERLGIHPNDRLLTVLLSACSEAARGSSESDKEALKTTCKKMMDAWITKRKVFVKRAVQFIEVFHQLRDVDNALETYSKYLARGGQEQELFFAILRNATNFRHELHKSRVSEIWNDHQASRAALPGHLLCTFIEAANAAKDLPLLNRLFAEWFRREDEGPTWDHQAICAQFIRAFDRVDQFDSLFDSYLVLYKKKRKPNAQVIKFLLEKLRKSERLDLILTVWDDLRKYNLPVSQVACDIFMSTGVRLQDPDFALQLFQAVEKKRIHPDYIRPHQNTLRKLLLSTNHPAEAILVSSLLEPQMLSEDE